MMEYVSSIGFSLNFEDHKNSVQVPVGEAVSFDGVQAKYVKKDGSEVSGRAPSLRSAINMKWLVPKTNGKATTEQVQEATQAVDRNGDKILGNSGEKYDNLRGGSFDEMMVKERVADRAAMSKNVLTEESLTVKKTGPIAVEEKKAAAAGEKLEIAGDQVQVKENVMVNSSTVTPPVKTHKTNIQRSEDYGADTTTPIKSREKSDKKEPPKKNAFTVDGTTPSVPEEATMAEVKRAIVKNDSETQEAQVVGKIKKGSLKVETFEGVDLKESAGSKEEAEATTEEGITFKTEKKAKQARTAGVKVSSGGESVTDLTAGASDGVTVVQKRASVNIPPQEKPDYLSMLPDDWGSLHWTKKEKFVKSLTDPGFLNFIMSVETIKAVQDACTARLEELGKE